jgi:hypothetical protein
MTIPLDWADYVRNALTHYELEETSYYSKFRTFGEKCLLFQSHYPIEHTFILEAIRVSGLVGAAAGELEIILEHKPPAKPFVLKLPLENYMFLESPRMFVKGSDVIVQLSFKDPGPTRDVTLFLDGQQAVEVS